MEFTVYYKAGDLRFDYLSEESKKRYIKEINDRNNNLTVDDITYALIDLIDNRTIEIMSFTKVYELDMANALNSIDNTSKMRPYISYEIRVFVKIDKNKIKEYCDFRDDFFSEVMSEIHSHRISSTICNKYNHYTTVDAFGRRFNDGWEREHSEQCEEFTLRPNRCVFVDEKDINKK